MSISEIILSNVSLDIERSQEQVYLKGVESLLKLVHIALEGEHYSKTIKLFLCDYHLRNCFNFKELSLLPPYLLSHCLNAMALKRSFDSKLEDFMLGGDNLIKKWQMNI